MNRHGQAAKFAYNPEAVLAYYAKQVEKNGHPDGWTDAVHGRTVRRWRSQKGITKHSFNSVFGCYNVKEHHFTTWAKAKGLAPILRNRNP